MNTLNQLYSDNCIIFQEGWRDWWDSFRNFNTKANNAYSKGAYQTDAMDSSNGPNGLKTLRNLNKTYSFIDGLKNMITSRGSLSDRLMNAKDASDRGEFRNWGISKGSNIFNTLKRYGRAFKLKRLRDLRSKNELSDKQYMTMQKKARGPDRIKRKYVWTPGRISSAITTT